MLLLIVNTSQIRAKPIIVEVYLQDNAGVVAHERCAYTLAHFSRSKNGHVKRHQALGMDYRDRAY